MMTIIRTALFYEIFVSIKLAAELSLIQALLKLLSLFWHWQEY